MEPIKTQGMNRDIIKYIAMFTMLLNHISHMFLIPGSSLGVTFTNIGYFTAITMCYFLQEGYTYTASKQKYGIRLLVFALLSQIPFTMALHSTRLNMLFTLLFCFLILVSMEKIRNPVLKILAIAGLILLCTICDWSFKAPLFTILFAKFKGSRTKTAIAYTLSWFLYFLFGLLGTTPVSSFFSSMGIAVSCFVILFFYNGKRSKRCQTFSKWFFYLFYPIHLLLLCLLQSFLIQ